ncbi:MAG: hypothetical protein ACE5GO_08325 [Anaerolineales bacterium]
MNELVIETSETPEVVVEAHGKLYVKGWDRAEVRARASGKDNLNLEQDGDRVTVTSQKSKCELRVPYGATLDVQVAQSETIIKSITGSINVHQANSSLTLQDVGSTIVGLVGCDLNARHVEGNLTVSQVGRFANVRNISGDFSVELVGAHLNLKSVAGDVTANAGANVTLSLNPQPGRAYKVEAHGVMTCRLPTDANAELNITGHGPITIKIGEFAKTSLNGTQNLTLGNGSATVHLTSYGPVTVLERGADREAGDFDFDFDFGTEFGEGMGNLSDQISQQVEEQLSSQMEMLEHQLESQLSGISAMIETSALSEEQAERIHRRTREKIARAQEKIRQAQARATIKIEKARRQAERKARKTARRAARSRGFSWTLSESGGTSAPKSEPVSEKERMMILNMLAEKKISIGEAESLLTALEGQGQ